MSTQFPTTVTAVVNSINSGELDLLEYIGLLESHFAACEPDVLAFVPEEGNRFQRLWDEANALLARYPDPEKRPSLFGVPIGVKDIFHVNGFTTYAGSKLPPHILQSEEAPAVTALRKAGALIMGKTVTTEFAYFGPGPTRNPFNPDHTPGGSSSGSAAAVGADLVPFAFGTQTIGSINRPAAFCGVVGYKPSYNRISKKNVLPLSESLDHVGGFTVDVTSMELIAGLLCQHWQWVVAERKPVLAIPEGPYLDRTSEEGRKHFRRVARQLHDAGFVVKSVHLMPDFDDIYARLNLIVAAEAARFHKDWYEEYQALYHPKTAELIERGLTISDNQLSRAIAGREKLRKQITRIMEQNSIDLWLSPPALGAAPKGLDSTGDPVMNLPWTHSGLPTLTLPAGKNEVGLPLGLQLTGRWYGDEAMLSFALQLEDVLRV